MEEKGKGFYDYSSETTEPIAETMPRELQDYILKNIIHVDK